MLTLRTKGAESQVRAFKSDESGLGPGDEGLSGVSGLKVGWPARAGQPQVLSRGIGRLSGLSERPQTRQAATKGVL